MELIGRRRRRRYSCPYVICMHSMHVDGVVEIIMNGDRLEVNTPVLCRINGTQRFRLLDWWSFVRLDEVVRCSFEADTHPAWLGPC